MYPATCNLANDKISITRTFWRCPGMLKPNKSGNVFSPYVWGMASWSFLIHYQWNFSWVYILIQVVNLTGSKPYYLAIWVSPERAKKQMSKSQRETKDSIAPSWEFRLWRKGVRGCLGNLGSWHLCLCQEGLLNCGVAFEINAYLRF